MKRIFTHMASMACTVSCLLLIGCERRELTYPVTPGELAIIPIHIDWSESQLVQNSESRVSIWFFPKDGRLPIENNFQGNITNVKVKAPVGDYAIIVMNEKIDDSRWKGVMEFRGTDKYETFAAYLLENNSPLVRARSRGSVYHTTPRPLAAWSLDHFTVTRSMIDLTRTRALAAQSQAVSRSGDGGLTKAEEAQVEQMLSKLSLVKPQPMVRSVFVKAKIKNLNSAYQSTAAFSWTAIGVSLATGEPIATPVKHLMNMNNAQIEANKKDGTVENRFLTFGLLNHSHPITIEMSFLMWDNKWLDDQHAFDVTQKTLESENYEIELLLGEPKPGEPQEENHTVVLPSSDAVNVGEWEDEYIDIK